MGQAFFPGGIHDRIGDGMWKMFLQAGGLPQELVRLFTVERDDLRHRGTRSCEGSCLVKYDRIGIGFEVFPALYIDLGNGSLPDRGKHRQRHGELQRAGIIHHQHGNGLGDISRQQKGQH